MAQSRRHCERSEAIHWPQLKNGLLRRFTPRNDDKKKAGIAPGLLFSQLPQFSEARFGGEAGHDLIRVS